MIRAGLVVIAAWAAFAQTPAVTPAFEVASVKPDKAGGNQGLMRGGPMRGGLMAGRESIHSDPGGLTMQRVRLSSAMAWAYDVKEYQISGPSWINLERYDIMAKAGGPVHDDQLKLMLRSLLAERFGLAFHRETRELPIYALLVAKGGPKLHESEGAGEMSLQPIVGVGTFVIVAERASLSQAADLMSRPLQRPVVDMTGLTGRYDVKLDLAPYLGDVRPGEPRTTPVGLSDVEGVIMAALEDQLGLKLEARKAPIDMLVIDHAERVPTEN